MNRTTPPRSATLSRLSAETTDPIADELRRYDSHLRDVRGLAAGTRRDRCRTVRVGFAIGNSVIIGAFHIQRS